MTTSLYRKLNTFLSLLRMLSTRYPCLRTHVGCAKKQKKKAGAELGQEFDSETDSSEFIDNQKLQLYVFGSLVETEVEIRDHYQSREVGVKQE